MTVRDWRRLPRTEVEPWYRAEQAWWSETLAWDTSPNWTIVEQARTAGTLPGFVLYEGAQACGWSFYLVHRSTLQVGGLTAPTRAAGAELLDAILASPEASGAQGAMVFVPVSQGWLAEILTERGFAVRPFRYLARTLDGLAGVPPAAQPTVAARFTELATLLSHAYPGADPARPFAPRGTWDEWVDYTTQLVKQIGCGVLVPECCVLEAGPTGVPGLLGAVLTTQLSAHTGHLAQVAVDPAFQRHGIGARMVRTALARLRGHGHTQATLLVADDNLSAAGMYARLGFVETGRFLSAWRPQPTRSTMAACSTGGVRTLR